jgi:hypothetical protein
MKFAGVASFDPYVATDMFGIIKKFSIEKFRNFELKFKFEKLLKEISLKV